MRPRTVALAAVVVLIAGVVLAQERKPAPPAPATPTTPPAVAAGTLPPEAEPLPPLIDARAEAQLKKMSDYLGGQTKFRFTAEVFADEVDEPDAPKLQFARTVKIDVARPDHLRASVEGDRIHRALWYDGKQVTVLDTKRNVYAVADVAPTIDGMLDDLAERYGVAAPLADLLFSDIYKTLSADIRTGRYVGLHKVGGKPCHHLAFTQRFVDWQIWIEDGAQPLPRKLVITYKDEPQVPQFVALLTEWDTKPQFAGDEFKFTPPANAAKVDMLPTREGAAGSAKR
jgi:hypothetical protein